MPTLPNSNAGRDTASLIHPYTNLDHHIEQGPVVMTRGDGVYVYVDAGKRYLEGMAGLWCTSLGFSEDRLVQAATRQMQALPSYRGDAQDLRGARHRRHGQGGGAAFPGAAAGAGGA